MSVNISRFGLDNTGVDPSPFRLEEVLSDAIENLPFR